MATARSDDPTTGRQTPPKPPSVGQSTAKATALTIGLVLLSRVLGVLRNILIGHIFGQTSETDQYWAAFGVPDLIALVIAGGGLSSVFIPVFAKYWNDGKEEDAWRIFGTVISIVMVAIAVLVLLMEIGVYPLTHLLNREFAPEAVARTAEFSRILLPAQWFLIVGGFMMGTLNARKQFLASNLGPLIYNAGAIIGGLTQWNQPHPDMTAMAWGTLIGAFLGSFLLQLIALVRVGVIWKLSFDIDHPGIRRVGQLVLPVILGLSLSQLIMWVTQRCLSDKGTITALKNAYDLTQAPIGIFAQAFGIVLLPTIADFAATKNWPSYRKAISVGIRQVLFLTIPASLLMSALALPIVRTVYVGGKLTEANGEVCATALLCYSLGTFAWSSLAILSRGFTARQEVWTPIKITTPMIFVFFGMVKFSLWLYPGSIVGVALSATIVGIITMVLFMYYLQRSAGTLGINYIVQSIIRTTTSSVVAAAAAYYLSQWMDQLIGHTKSRSFITLVFAGSVGIVLYAAMSYFVFRSKELRSIGQMFRKRR